MAEAQGTAHDSQAMSGQVRIVAPTAANARRLWKCYQQAYLSDADLLLRACCPEMGIDALTERLTPDDVGEAMQMPDTVTFDVGPADGADPVGFVIARYASRDAHSKEVFNAYFLGDVFRRDALRFRTTEDQIRFFERMDYGEVAYFAEFVSAGGRAASASLVVAAYHEICLTRLAAPSCMFVGKCLDSVQIGCCTNAKGNRPVKALAEFLGLEKIALCDQIRQLNVSNRADLLARAFPDRAAVSSASIDAVLTFALYCGSARLAAEKVGHRI